MKTMGWVATGVGVVLAAGVAVAQVPNAPPPDAPPPQAPGTRGPMAEMGGDMGPGEHRHGWGGMMRGMRHGPPPSKAARFMIRRGDSVVAIKCADDEPMKACVDAGSALLDKLGAMPK